MQVVERHKWQHARLCSTFCANPTKQHLVEVDTQRKTRGRVPKHWDHICIAKSAIKSFSFRSVNDWKHNNTFKSVWMGTHQIREINTGEVGAKTQVPMISGEAALRFEMQANTEQTRTWQSEVFVFNSLRI